MLRIACVPISQSREIFNKPFVPTNQNKNIWGLASARSFPTLRLISLCVSLSLFWSSKPLHVVSPLTLVWSSSQHDSCEVAGFVTW